MIPKIKHRLEIAYLSAKYHGVNSIAIVFQSAFLMVAFGLMGSILASRAVGALPPNQFVAFFDNPEDYSGPGVLSSEILSRAKVDVPSIESISPALHIQYSTIGVGDKRYYVSNTLIGPSTIVEVTNMSILDGGLGTTDSESSYVLLEQHVAEILFGATAKGIGEFIDIGQTLQTNSPGPILRKVKGVFSVQRTSNWAPHIQMILIDEKKELYPTALIRQKSPSSRRGLANLKRYFSSLNLQPAQGSRIIIDEVAPGYAKGQADPSEIIFGLLGSSLVAICGFGVVSSISLRLTSSIRVIGIRQILGQTRLGIFLTLWTEIAILVLIGSVFGFFASANLVGLLSFLGGSLFGKAIVMQWWIFPAGLSLMIAVVALTLFGIVFGTAGQNSVEVIKAGRP